MFDFIILRLW